MIFQQGNFSNYVGKIRLTKDFSGKLPDGTLVDLQTLKLRDVLALYPTLKDARGSRGCSDYLRTCFGEIWLHAEILWFDKLG